MERLTRVHRNECTHQINTENNDQIINKKYSQVDLYKRLTLGRFSFIDSVFLLQFVTWKSVYLLLSHHHPSGNPRQKHLFYTLPEKKYSVHVLVDKSLHLLLLWDSLNKPLPLMPYVHGRQIH